MDLNNGSTLTAAAMRKRKIIGFTGAACSLAVTFGASSAPIPLYSIYRQEIGLTSSDLSMTAVAYFVGTMIALLMFARLSNHLGRRPVVFATLGLAVLGCLIFIYLDSAPMFMLGRFIQGFACGLASSTITTYIVDTAPTSPAWIGAAVTSGAPMVGLAAGSFGSGALKQYGPGSQSLIFWIIIAILICCVALTLISPETVTRNQGALSSIVPQIRVPKNIRPLLPAASAVFIGTWAIGGFYQAFSSTIAAERLHTTNTLTAAAVFACLMAPNAIGSLLVGRLKAKTAQRMGICAFFLCVVAILVALKVGSVILFLAASVLAGVAQGTAFTGSMRRLLLKTGQQDRAGVLSTIYLLSYSGAAVPNLIVGRLSGRLGLFQIATGYVLLVAVACIVTLFTSHWGTDRSSDSYPLESKRTFI